MRRRPPLVGAALAAFVAGAGLLVAFDKPVTLAAGVVLLLTFVVIGVFAIATPEYLKRAPGEEEEPR